MSGVAGRRDTPAARAALARRRQRVAQTMRPAEGSSVAATTGTTTNALPIRSASAKAQRPSAIPTTVSRSANASLRPRSTPRSSSQQQQQQQQRSKPPTLVVDTRNAPSKATTRAGVNNNSRMSPLSRRAMQKKSPTSASIMDTTHTTMAMTTSTYRPSPEKKPQSPLAKFVSVTNPIPSSVAAETSKAPILNAVHARSLYRSSSPRASPRAAMSPKSSPRHSNAVAQSTSFSGSPSPSRLAQQEELLASSKRRRQAYENRFQPDTPLATPSRPNVRTGRRSPSPVGRSPKTPSQGGTPTKIIPRPAPTSVETLRKSQTPPSKPGASPSRVIPRRNPSPARRNSPLKALSPHRFRTQTTSSSPKATKPSTPVAKSPQIKEYLPPSSPSLQTTAATQPQPTPVPTPQSKSQPRNHQSVHSQPSPSIVAKSTPQQSIVHRANSLPRRMRQRSPSPSRPVVQPSPTLPFRKTAPSPIQTTQEIKSKGSFSTTSSLQSRAMQMKRNRSQSSSSPQAKSPGMQHLSAILRDTSFNDASTIADMTQHQMETPKTSANLSFSANSSSGITLSVSRPLFTPNKNHGAGSNGYSGIEYSSAILDSDRSSNVDSACLKSGCRIMIRSYSQPITIGLDDAPDSDAPYQLAKLNGKGLGFEQEVFKLQKVVPSKLPASGDSPMSSDLRLGESVVLISLAAGNRPLGTRKFVNSSGTIFKMELGFFTNKESEAEIWTILSARPDQEVLVGRAAIAARKNSNQRNAPTDTPVRSGDPILLRNLHTGGILSMDQRGTLVLLTDSYEHEEATNPDPTLLGRLQNHDRLHPMPKDAFQLILAETPPCPPWIAQKSVDERVFLTGSYLLQPQRNEASADFEMTLFGSHGPSNSVLEAAQRYAPSNQSLSPKTKESILIDEVLGSFLGLEGHHIRLKSTKTKSGDQYEFHLVGADGVTFDAGLRNLVEQMLPLSTSYVRVRNFVSSRYPGYEYGRVMQAFCEALDHLLQEYVVFVSKLESKFREYSKMAMLTMKSIYFEITSSLHTMSILEHTTTAVRDTKGGALINVLWALDKRSYTGDSAAKRVLGILLERAAFPYMDMMSAWLQMGRLQDPYKEFMIVQSQKIGGSTRFDGDTWATLYQVRPENVIQRIVPNDWTKERILTTGKYWTAVKNCHAEAKELQPSHHRQVPQVSFVSETSDIASYIDAMYQSASKALVRTMMEKFKLIESLQIMKRYFLIDQGDFLMHFLDAAESELLKHESDVSMGRIQHALSTSIHLTESHRDDSDLIAGMRQLQDSSVRLIPNTLRSRFAEESLVQYLDRLYGGGIANQAPTTPSRHAYGMSKNGNTGIEVFSIDFQKVPFPLSLVLSRKAMDSYKLLFRHLFSSKHVERRLIGVWRDHQLLKKLDTIRGPLGPTFLLRQRMLHFVQNLIYYMVYEVVEGHWTEMQGQIDRPESTSSGAAGKQQTVDDILRVHNEFLEHTLEACLLKNRDLVRCLTKVMNTCLLFTDQMKRFMDTTKIHDDSINLAAEKRGAVQRNLNERGYSQSAVDKRALRRALASTKEERRLMNTRQTRRVSREVSSDSYKRMIERFNEVFNQDLTEFMLQLNSSTSSGIVANLGIRLDYNGFVTATVSNSTSR